MTRKRAIFILLLLIIAVGTLTSVNANNITDDVISDENADEIDMTNTQDNEDIIDSIDDGTFTALQNKINSAGEGATITLDNDYSYNTNFGSTNGVKITKSLTINGNGHTIDGMGKSRLLQIENAQNIVLNNIVFKNGYDNSDTGAVRVNNVNSFKMNSCNYTENYGYVAGFMLENIGHSTISNSHFTDNYGDGWALFIRYVDNSSILGCNFNNSGVLNEGAIFTRFLNTSSIANCNFSNNNVSYYGGAIFSREIGEVSVTSCRFYNNIAEDYGGGIFSYLNDYVVVRDCIFDSNYASEGGAINSYGAKSFYLINSSVEFNWASYGGGIIFTKMNNIYLINSTFMDDVAEVDGGGICLFNCNYSSFDSCTFKYNKALGAAGGSIYLEKSAAQLNNCNFDFNNAIYGACIHSESSEVYIKKSTMSLSISESFGGAISSRFSNMTVDECDFKSSISRVNSGGAIYNFRSNLNVITSSFIGGHSKMGGAISSSDSNLTVLSSTFINNTAANGGAIHTIYGNALVDDCMFKNSKGDLGCAINCVMSDSLTFTNNKFLNSTGKNSANILLIYPSANVTESGNHYENAYHLAMAYSGYINGELVRVYSKTINYIVSNTGEYLNTYNYKLYYGNSTETVSLDFWDPNHPDDTIIYCDYTNFITKYVISKASYVDEGSEYLEGLSLYIVNDARETIDILSVTNISSVLEKNGTFEMFLDENTIMTYNHLTHESGSIFYSVPLINSTLSEISGIPSTYDSRDYGYITSVKNQGSAGNCWAFSGLATLEACFKKATGLSVDFSENNAKNLMALYSLVGLHLNTNTGGYDSMIMAYLNSWIGPIGENIEPYDGYTTLSSVYYPMIHVQNIKFLPARQSATDNDLYKRAIMDYGAVAVTFNFGGQGLHAVSLVGWDDNYNDYDSLGTYTKGAWIFKNSWGPEWGNNGFGYLSYQNMFTSDYRDYAHAYTFVFNKEDSYTHNYQYDDAGVSDYIVTDGHAYYSNKFTSQSYGDIEYLSAFATYFKYPTKYVVSVYVNSTLVLTQSGSSSAGYYTIPFNKKIPLNTGDEFVIMVENCNNGENYVPVCQADELNRAHYGPNTSFISYDGETWNDLFKLKSYTEFLYGPTQKNTCQVACIKAFTSMYDTVDDDFFNAVYTVHINVSEFSNLDLNENIVINITVKGESDYYSSAVDSLIDQTLFSISINGKDYYTVLHNGQATLKVSFDNAGLHTLKAEYRNNLFRSNTVQFRFTVNKGNSAISATSVTKFYGGSEKSTVTLKDTSGKPISNAEITVKLNGKTIKIRTNSKGQASLPIDVIPKTYTATITFAGNGNYIGSSTTAKIVVKKATPKITASKKTFKLKVKTKKYTITMKDKFGKVMKKAKVTIKINGKTYKATTNAKGKATFKITKLKKKGTFTATVKYTGTSCYNTVSKKVKITVKK